MATTLDQVIGIANLAARPTAGSAGRLFFASDIGVTYRDNGGSWDLWTGAVNLIGTHAARPAAGTYSPTLYYESDTLTLWLWNGAAWSRLWTEDLIDPSVPTWAWLNQGSATIVSDSVGQFLQAPREAGASQIRGRITASGSVPYTFTSRLEPCLFQESNSTYGLVLYDSVTGKLLVFRVTLTVSSWAVLSIDTYTSAALAGAANVFSTQVALLPKWLRIQDDGTHRTYFVSGDGSHWAQVYQEATVTYLTPNNAGFFVWGPVSTSQNVPSSVTLESWQKS